jgi:hypothetical protein
MVMNAKELDTRAAVQAGTARPPAAGAGTNICPPANLEEPAEYYVRRFDRAEDSRSPEITLAQRFSRTEAGVTSFGMGVKILVSLAAAPAMILGLFLVVRLLSMSGRASSDPSMAALAFVFFVAVLLLVCGGAALSIIWRRTRVR